MPQVQLDRLCVHDANVTHWLQQADPVRGEQAARQALSMAMADLAATQLHQGRVEPGIKLLQDALNTCPSSQFAFHNLIAAMMGHRLLRGNNLDRMAQFVADHIQKFEWVRQYMVLLVLPRFINVEFVSGKCNLKCRMCLGTNSQGHPNVFSSMAADDFEALLAAVPTASGITLSSGDSDPLMHPEFERILQIAAKHGVPIDIYTNGHALTQSMCDTMVRTAAVNVINFSIDAATPETYRRVRGASFEHVIGKLRMLNAAKAQAKAVRPGISLSFVAMADNIQELPDFVRLALEQKAFRVYVEYLNGWNSQDGENLVPSQNPRHGEYVREAQAIAAGTGLDLALPDRMLAEVAREDRDAAPKEPGGMIAAQEKAADANGTAPKANEPLDCCSWVRGVYVQKDGSIDPCCLVHRVADMGNVREGPLHTNDKHLHVKRLLMSGRVFKDCLSARLCPYVQQRLAQGQPPTLITAQDLGHCALPEKPRRQAPEPEPAAV